MGIPLLIVVLWHAQNTLLPAHDAADYFRSALNNYLVWQDKGFFAGLIDTYLNRGWRPIFFAAYIVPFIMIADGDFLLSVGLTLSVTFFLLLTFIYLTVRHYAGAFRAAIVTTFIGTMAWVEISGFYIFSEVFLFMSMSMALFFAVKCDYLRNRRYSILFGLGLGICLISKPAPFIMSMSIPVIAFVIRSYALGNFSTKQAFAFIYVMLMLGLTLILQAVFVDGVLDIVPSVLSIGAYILVTGTGLYFFWKDEIKAPIVQSAVVCGLIMVIWWMPSFRAYLDYAFVGGLGAMAKLYHLTQRNFLDTINHFFVARGGWPLLVAFGSAITAISFYGTGRSLIVLIMRRARLLGGYFLIVLAIASIPLILAAMSPGADPRRAELSFLAIFIITLVVAVKNRSWVGTMITTILLGFTGVQALHSFAAVADIDYPGKTVVGRYLPEPSMPFTKGDPSKKVYKILSEWGLAKGSVATFTFRLDLVVGGRMKQSFDTGILQALAFNNRQKLYFGYPWEFYSLEEGYKKIKPYDYVLLDVGNYPETEFSDGPYSMLTYDLINKWRSGKLEEVGLSQEFSFVVNEVQYVFLRNVRDNPSGALAGATVPSILGDAELAYADIVPGATDFLEGYPPIYLADANAGTVWGSSETDEDTIFYVARSSAMHPRFIRLFTASGSAGSHLKDLSVVGGNDKDGKWKILRAKLSEQDAYSEKVIAPNVPNETIVEIQIDPDSLPEEGFTHLGIAVFSKSMGYERNYITGVGKGIYIREFSVYGADK